MIGLIIFSAGRLSGVNQAACHDEHRKAAGHDEGHRGGLAFEAPQVAEKFSIEMREHGRQRARGYQRNVEGATRVAFRCSLKTRPSEK